MGQTLTMKASSLDKDETSVLIDTITETEALLTAFRVDLDAITMSAGLKNILRAKIEKLQKRIFTKKNEVFMANFAENIRKTLDEVKAYVDSDNSSSNDGSLSNSASNSDAVFVFHVGTDSKAIKKAISQVQKSAPDLSFCGIS